MVDMANRAINLSGKLLDMTKGEVPVRSAMGAMRSMHWKYSRYDEPSPEGFGHIILDPEQCKDADWYVDFYRRLFAEHLYNNGTGGQSEEERSLLSEKSDELIKRYNPLNAYELTDRGGLGNTEDRPFPPLLNDLVYGNREDRERAYRYIMGLRGQTAAEGE